MKSLLIITVLLALISFDVKSEVKWLDISLASKHIGVGDKFNEENYGLGITTKNNFIVGFFKNSYSDWVVYGGQEFMVESSGEIKVGVGVKIGLIAGYEQVPVFPMILPTASVNFKDDYRVVMGVIPIKSNSGNLGAVVTLQVSVGF